MKRLALAMLLCACGNDNSHHGLLVDAPGHDIDAAAPDAGPPGPNIVNVSSYGATPDYIAYRDGAGAWATPTMTSQGMYELKVKDAYVLVAVCVGDAGAIDAEEIAATFSTDGGTNYFYCTGPAGNGPPTTVAVTGQMTQAGSIFFEDSAKSPTGDWTFSLNVDPGTHDLIAVDSTTIRITRDQAVTVAEALPAIDVSTGGTALASVPITISGSQVGDMVGTEVDLATANDYYTSVLTSANATLAVVPDALLTSNDGEYISAYSESASAYRVVETLDPTLTTFPLLPLLTGITFGAGTVEASWTTLPVTGSTQLVAFGTGTTTQIADLTVTPSWLAAQSATSLTFDISAPGWMPAWSFWTTSAYAQSFQISQSSQTQYASTSLSNFGTSGFAKRIAKQHQRALRMHRRR